MPSTSEFLDSILTRINSAGDITYKKSQHDYNIYCNGKMVALINNNRFFVRCTEEAKLYMGKFQEVPPYPGAHLHLFIRDLSEQYFSLAEVIRLTYEYSAAHSRKSQKRD